MFFEFLMFGHDANPLGWFILEGFVAGNPKS
jgi:hypothetical protein